MKGRSSNEFIVGPENRLAGAAVWWMLNSGQRSYSPLVLHGPSGSGKSHLARGLAESRQDVVATHGADFVRELAAAVDQNTVAELRKRYRSAGMLVFEDLTELVERRAAQRELLHTLDALELRAVPVVVTSRVPPGEIADLPPALRSRLSGGLQVALAPPGLAARIEILNRLAAAREIEFAPAAVQLLAENLSGAVPDLQGALLELVTVTIGVPPVGKCTPHAPREEFFTRSVKSTLQLPDWTGISIQVDQVRRYLAARRTRLQPSMATITKIVAKYYGLKSATLGSSSRRRQVALARSMAIYLGRQFTGQSLKALGKQFGNRDHSTVLYSYRTLERRLETDAELRGAVANLRSLLAAA